MRRLFVVLALLCASCSHHTRSLVAPNDTIFVTAPPSEAPAPTLAPSIRPSTPLPHRLSLVVPGAGSATQAIVVRTSGWNSTVGSLEAFAKDGGAWHIVVPPTKAYVGYNGFAQNKREGDGRTPAGVYGFSFAFGTQPDPATHLSYRRVGPSDVWVDDPTSSLYNTWQRGPSNGRWKSAEQLNQAAYAYAAAIAYNTARTSGKGSAIFLHVSWGHATSGCVSVDRSVVIRLLRWLDPSRKPVIVMGPSSYVDHL